MVPLAWYTMVSLGMVWLVTLGMMWYGDMVMYAAPVTRLSQVLIGSHDLRNASLTLLLYLRMRMRMMMLIVVQI